MLKKIALLSLFSLLILSCNKKSSTEPENTNPLYGTWNLTTMKVNGVIVNPNEWYDVAVKIIINSDGTGTVWFEDYGNLEGSFSFTWHTNGNQISIQVEGEDATSATYSRTINILTLLFSDGWEFIYTKQT